MGKGIGLVAGKGGVGKTTTTYNVASGFSIMERTEWTYKLGQRIPPPSEERKRFEYS
jgi:Mrp family chromosome partitioning ATPase